MPEQLLNRPDIITILQQVGRKRMAQSVGTCRLGKSSFPHGLFYRFLQDRFVKMVPLFASDSVRLRAASPFFYVPPSCLPLSSNVTIVPPVASERLAMISAGTGWAWMAP